MIRFLKWWWNEYDIKMWVSFVLFVSVVIGIPSIILFGLFELEDKYFGTEILLITTCLLFVAFFIYGFIMIGIDELKSVKRNYEESKGSD